jgi:hypothetical protein
MGSPPLANRPRAEAASVEDLLVDIRRGAVRIPRFQRPFSWKRDDVKRLLDSVWRGYPVGSLLLWERPARADRLQVGPLSIDAPEHAQASWVVDGQQRLTALAGSLLHPGTLDAGVVDDFAWFFDLEREEFVAPRASPPPSWIPVNVMGSSVETLKWARSKPDLIANRTFEISKALREYRLPLYVVADADEGVLREIFDRLNSNGRRLTAGQVFNALHGGASEDPDSLTALADHLDGLRFGRLDEDLLLTALFAIRGLDITRTAGDQARDPRLTGALPAAEQALRRTIVFLKTHARIPHMRVLPYRLAVPVLARFFSLHPEPRSRSLDLLSRWLWRGAVSGVHGDSSRAYQREQPRSVGQDEEASIQQLLKQLPAGWTPSPASVEYRLSQKAQSRIQTLALIALGPRHLESGAAIEAALLLEQLGIGSLPEVLPRRKSMPSSERALARGVANRLFHEPASKAQIQAWVRTQGDPEVVRSQGIDDAAREALLAGEGGRFLSLRNDLLASHLDRFVKARTAWNLSDRPSLQYVLTLDDAALAT